MTIGNRDMLAFAVWCVGLIVLTAMLAGCAAVKPTPIAATGSAITRADTRAEGVGRNMIAIAPHVDEAGKPLVVSTAQLATGIRNDLKDAAQSNAKAAADYAALQARYDKVYNSIGCKIERAIKRFAWIIGGLFGLALVLRLVGFYFTGGVGGSIASFVSTGIFGLFSGGISWIQSLFDNLWFRVFAPQPARQVEINTTGAS